jgi:hypothetical protein
MPKDGHNEGLARLIRKTLAAMPYLDDMGFDSYHPPVWDDGLEPPKVSKDFRYVVIEGLLNYFFRRSKEHTRPVSAYELRAEIRRYLAVSNSLRHLQHPQATYGEITLAAVVSGFRVEIDNSEGKNNHWPIIYLGRYFEGYEYKGMKTK